MGIGVSTAWGLEDIKDVRRYVAGVVKVRMASHIEAGDEDEAIAAGIEIVYRLHSKWDPKRCASFRDFVSTYLALRLIDWWRQEMRQRNICRRNGKTQEYIYTGVASLDEMVGQDHGGHANNVGALITHDTRLGD